MSATGVTITQQEFEELLDSTKIAWWRDEKRESGWEILYFFPLKGTSYVAHILSTIPCREGAVSRKKGEDAIRISLHDQSGNLKASSKLRKVYRTKNWRQNLLGVLRTYWTAANDAGVCETCKEPLTIFKTKFAAEGEVAPLMARCHNPHCKDKKPQLKTLKYKGKDITL